MEENPTTRAGLQAMKFRLLGTTEQLQKSGILWYKELQSPGVYAIVCTAGYEHSFLSLDETLKLKNVIDPWPHQKLEAKWVDRADVLYFGKAMNPRGAGQGKNANTLGGGRHEISNLRKGFHRTSGEGGHHSESA